jgi:hypothetical protein
MNDARVKPLDRAVDALPELVEATIAQARVARHEPAHSGHAETPFPPRFALVAHDFELGIHEHGQRHGPGLGVARVVVDLEYDDAQQHADLDGREPCAVVGAHGVEHVGDERFELRGRELRHRCRHPPKTRVT